jgi:hypothetical protein
MNNDKQHLDNHSLKSGTVIEHGTHSSILKEMMMLVIYFTKKFLFIRTHNAPSNSLLIVIVLNTDLPWKNCQLSTKYNKPT